MLTVIKRSVKRPRAVALRKGGGPPLPHLDSLASERGRPFPALQRPCRVKRPWEIPGALRSVLTHRPSFEARRFAEGSRHPSRFSPHPQVIQTPQLPRPMAPEYLL